MKSTHEIAIELLEKDPIGYGSTLCNIYALGATVPTKDIPKLIEAFEKARRFVTAGEINGVIEALQKQQTETKEDEKVDEKFFPEYLNKGSEGPPVALLQFLLLSTAQNHKIIIDGIYGEETARGVEKLQEFLEIKVDGHFGPGTRQELATGVIDINEILASAFAGKTKAVSPV